MGSIVKQIVEIPVPAIRVDIAGGTLRVPLGRMQERVVDHIADFPVPRHGDGVDQDADSPVPLTRKSWQNKKVLFE